MPLDVKTVGAVDAPTSGLDLEVTGLSKRYADGPWVFSGVDFKVQRGESVALVGSNGTGKSTLLRCCLGLLPATEGQIRLLDRDWSTMKPSDRRGLRARTGLVAQKHNLVPRLSVLSNVVHGLLGSTSGPRYWLQALAPAEARDRAMEALAKVGVQDFALRRAERLSGGQSQRVAIARALVGGPRILVADEPTASLDPAAGEEVMELFFDLVRREGVTVIFTSHNIDHALRYGDRVLGLAGGGLSLSRLTSDLSSADLRGLYG
ncbi:phosphonate ABC transporter ATP-binding protein [Halovulum sp. GXIMD14793]